MHMLFYWARQTLTICALLLLVVVHVERDALALRVVHVEQALVGHGELLAWCHHSSFDLRHSDFVQVEMVEVPFAVGRVSNTTKLST